jgi:hypothetical protein
MSSGFFTGIKKHKSGMTREYVDGYVTQVVYPANYRGKKYTYYEINRNENRLLTTDKYNPFIGEEEWSLSYIWEEYSSIVIGVIILIVAIITFFLYRNISSPSVNITKNVTENVKENVTENVVENIVAAFGNIF